MILILLLQAVFQVAPGILLQRQLIKGSAGRSFTLAAVRQVFLGKLLLVSGRLSGQLVGLPHPSQAGAHCQAKQQGKQRPPRPERNQSSTCSARL